MLREVRLLHTSDVHLDNDIGGPGEESVPQLGFMHVIDKALELEVDMLLLAGDLFDHNRIKQPCLDFVLEQLSRLSCPMVMVTGNHDCLADYSIYHRFDPRDAGGHVHFIQDEAGSHLDFDELGIRIWGRGIVEHHPGHQPLAAEPELHDEYWNLGMTHGYYVNRGAEMFSSLITPEEIEATGFHYLALGHVHVFTEVQHGDTRAVYPGSPNLHQGTREASAAEVTLKPDEGVKVIKIELGKNPTEQN